MITTETFHTGSALRALRLINKARQCAKRGDVRGMFDYTEQACTACICAPTVSVTDMRVANFVAHKFTYQIRTLTIVANKGKCETFVRLTRYLKDELHELICVLHKGRTHGLWG